MNKKLKNPPARPIFENIKARFPLGEFVRATRSENKNPATWLVKIGWRKNSPRTSRKRSYFFVCSREQIRLVENGLKGRSPTIFMWPNFKKLYCPFKWSSQCNHKIVKENFASINTLNYRSNMQLWQNANQHLIVIRRVHCSQPWTEHKQCWHEKQLIVLSVNFSAGVKLLKTPSRGLKNKIFSSV